MLRSFECLLVFGMTGAALAWQCRDDGSTRALSNNQDPGNYRIRYSGGDDSVRVIVRDGAGNETFNEPLPTDPEGLLVGVPLGGSVEVVDASDRDSKAGEGSIAKE